MERRGAARDMDVCKPVELFDNASDTSAKNQKSWIPFCHVGIFIASAMLKVKRTVQTSEFRLLKPFPYKDKMRMPSLPNLFVLVLGDEKHEIRMTTGWVWGLF